jgi:ParB/RepB/Spo0J family partition protein
MNQKYALNVKVLIGTSQEKGSEKLNKEKKEKNPRREEPMPEIKKIPISRIIITGDNPRQEFRNDDLTQLGMSIKTHGLLQPIIVRPKGNRFELVVGERRLKASELVGLTEIDARIEELDDATTKELRLIENTHREDLTDAEKGDAVYALWEGFPEKYPSIKSIADAITTPYGTVQKWCSKSRKLSENVKQLVARSQLTERAAQSLLKYDHATQDKLAKGIVQFDVHGGREGAEREFIRLYEENPKTNLRELAEKAKGNQTIPVPIMELSPRARKEVEGILQKKKEEAIETRKESIKKAAHAPRRIRPRRISPTSHPSDVVLSKAEILKNKLEELEPTEREKLARNVGERIDYLTRKVELERDVAKDKEMKELLEQWRTSVPSKIRKETPESFVTNLDVLLSSTLDRIGAEYPDTAKEVGRKGLVTILSMNQLEKLDKKLEYTISELRNFQVTIKSELFMRRSRTK